MDAEFLSQIENPRSHILEELLESAVTDVEEHQQTYDDVNLDEWAVRKMAFTYYYNWETDNPDFVFLLTDPGSIDERHMREAQRIAALKNEYDPLSLVDIYRNFATTWFTETRNSDFIGTFLATCNEMDLIAYENYWKDYIRSREFFNDFYMTDIVKYRAPRSTVGSPEVQVSFSEQLREELEGIDPDLIFTFGNRAWTPIEEELATEPIDDLAIDESKITELHGHLHKTGGVIDAHVLPLGHMSTQFYGAQISKQEYMSRMEDGLERWKLEMSN